jgi:DNA-directed RNA polymerase specialized sigma24 family protein
MERSRPHRAIDFNGSFLPERIQRVLDDLSPRLQRQFPALHDDAVLAEVLEEAGRRIVRRETRSGAIEKLHAYAWVTLRSVAASHSRLGATQVTQRTLRSEASQARLASSPAVSGCVEEIERRILLREVLAHLSREERLICVWKKAGFTTEQIAHFLGRSVTAVDTIFCRAKQKIRRLLGIEQPDPERSRLVPPSDGPLENARPLEDREIDEAGAGDSETSR